MDVTPVLDAIDIAFTAALSVCGAVILLEVVRLTFVWIKRSLM